MHRIQLGNDEFEGLNNAYLFVGDGPTTLVDTGVATDAVRTQLERGLEEGGVGLEEVDAVVLTHWHPDHAGLAGHVQEAAEATVYVHEEDAPVVTGEGFDELEEIRRGRFEEWGVPADRREEIDRSVDKSVPLAGHDPDVETVTDGDAIPAGDETLRVLHSPGHTAGLCCFEIEGADEALSADAVLPVYTPNIGGADPRVERPLATYRETLHRIDDRGFDRLHPGHRDVIDDPHERIQTIVEHHRDRTDRVIEALSTEGPGTAWEVSARLFGELEGIHVLHGPGEAWAHLDHLESEGVLERDGTVYRLAEEPDRPGSR